MNAEDRFGMRHHVLVQLLYRFLDLLIGHMLLLLPIGIGRGIALLLALSILNDCCRLIDLVYWLYIGRIVFRGVFLCGHFCSCILGSGRILCLHCHDTGNRFYGHNGHLRVINGRLPWAHDLASLRIVSVNP